MARTEFREERGRQRSAAFAAALLLVTAVAGIAAAQGPSDAVKALPAPKIAWERMIDVPVRPERSDERPDPLGEVLAIAPRFDGGAVIASYDPAAKSTGGLRLLAIDGAGKTVLDVPIAYPAGAAPQAFITNSVAINADAPAVTWVFQTWRPPSQSDIDEGPAPSRLLAFDADGRQTVTTRLAERIAGGRDVQAQRKATILRRMPDGSLLAGGTIYYGPPIWWFARFTVSGKLLHEISSKKFPDYIEDARGNVDGGYSLLMVDAEDGSEKPTVRRYGANGKLIARYPEPDLPQSLSCAVLLGPLRQMRVISDDTGTVERRRSDVVMHVPGRGIVSRLDLGALGCDGLARTGDSVLLTAAELPVQDDAAPVFIGFVDDKPRWKKKEADLAIGAPTADGGAVVLTVVKDNGRDRMKLSRYQLP